MSYGLYGLKIGFGLGLVTVFLASPICSAQDRDRDWNRDWDQNRGVFTRLEPGAVVPVRMNQTVDVEHRDNRVYYGTVDQDVYGGNGRIAIPRGSNAELMVRVAPDNDLVIDLESVVVNGNRYAVRTEPDRMQSPRDNSIVGQIVGAVTGAQLRGPAVRIPRGSVVTFRLDRPLEMGVADRGVDRDGVHYHDWYGHDHQ